MSATSTPLFLAATQIFGRSWTEVCSGNAAVLATLGAAVWEAVASRFFFWGGRGGGFRGFGVGGLMV